MKQYTRRIRVNGLTLWAKWQKGFKNHCYLMAKNWKWDDKWAGSGNAQVALLKKDLV